VIVLAPTLFDLLVDSAQELPDQDWLYFETTVRWFSRREVLSRARRVAGMLQAADLKPGDRVAYLLENRVESVEALFGIIAADGIAVPLNTAWRRDGIEAALSTCEPKVVICEASHRELLPSSTRATIVVADRGSGLAEGFCYDELPPPARSGRDPCLILFTSGTTGRSKGVVHTSTSMIHMARQAANRMANGPNDVFYTCLPLFHANALGVSLIPSLLCKAALVVAKRFSATNYWDHVRCFRVTTTSMLGAMVPFLLNQPGSHADDQHDLRAAMVVPVTPSLNERLLARFGVRAVGAYGLTDMGHLLWVPVNKNAPAGSCGIPTEGFECRLVDDDDQEVEVGEVGELVCRPLLPWIMSPGYWYMPEATVEAWRNLWFHTGDLLRRDAEGWYYFVDRKKDAIRRRGENISSTEVEQAVLRIDGIVECAAFPIPSEWSEDEVAIAIVPALGSVPEMDKLIADLSGSLPRYAVPRYVRVMTNLPKTATAKVRKDLLRRDSVTSDMWDREAVAVQPKRTQP
jgi:crotonobetaine/carnitine-CoA ligase